MLTMKGKIDISKRTFILIYLPFRFSNLVKATNAALHKDSQESKKANKIGYHCLFCVLYTSSTVELSNKRILGELAHPLDPCIRGHNSRQVDYKESSRRLFGIQAEHSVRMQALVKRSPRRQILRTFFPL